MTAFTSTLPEDLLNEWAEAAAKLHVPKNKLMEQALRIYLSQLKKAAYAKSYARMAGDVDVMKMVEEGLAEYYIQLNKE